MTVGTAGIGLRCRAQWLKQCRVRICQVYAHILSTTLFHSIRSVNLIPEISPKTKRRNGASAPRDQQAEDHASQASRRERRGGTPARPQAHPSSIRQDQPGPRAPPCLRPGPSTLRPERLLSRGPYRLSHGPQSPAQRAQLLKRPRRCAVARAIAARGGSAVTMWLQGTLPAAAQVPIGCGCARH